MSKDIQGVVYPRSKAEVIQLINEARVEDLKLYPISCGRNWGYGTKLPASDNNMIVDLGQMNRILEIDLEHGYCVIEPGVTQQQLYNALKDTEYYFDMTGSSSQTSVLGNIIERGVGYQKQRTELLNALEVVTGTGKVLKTGMWAQTEESIAHLYTKGLGPNLTEVFTQSNFGIVTKASIKILKKPQSGLTFNIGITHSDLGSVVEVIKGFIEQGVIQGIPHIASRSRFESTVKPLVYRELYNEGASLDYDRFASEVFDRDWYIVGKIQGDFKVVNAQKTVVNKTLSKFGKVYFLDREEKVINSIFGKLVISKNKRLLLKASKNLRGLSYGVPTDDGVLGSVWSQKNNQLLDESDISGQNKGWIFFTPVGPLDSDTANEFYSIATDVTSSFDMPVAITLNVLSASVLEAVISINFDKKSQGPWAHQCIEKMVNEFKAKGYYPYRLGIQTMEEFVKKDNSFWSISADIKAALDPDNVIAPKRYSLH